MAEFEAGGHTYRSGKIDAFTQAHLIRRLTPALGSLREVATKASDFAKPEDDIAAKLAATFDVLEPLAKMIAQMPDADFDYVVHACLGATSRQSGNGWASVFNKDAKALMFEDIDVSAMIFITVNVLKESLTPFILGLASTFGVKA